MKICDIIERLEKNIDDDFVNHCHKAIEDIEEMIEPFSAVEPLLVFMEKNPDIEYGMPGPLVHFVEKFYGNGYEAKLVESIKRKPTKHTLWMLSRVINGSSEFAKKEYLSLLTDIFSETVLVDEEIKSEAKEFWSSHQ